jgi:hypothetical protein
MAFYMAFQQRHLGVVAWLPKENYRKQSILLEHNDPQSFSLYYANMYDVLIFELAREPNWSGNHE